MIIARQIDPAYQQSPFENYGLTEIWDGIFLDGNRAYSRCDDAIFLEAYEDAADEFETCKNLEKITGKKYDMRVLRGSCQSEWVNAYYPASEYDISDLIILETEFFNTGSEWEIDDNDGDRFCVYCNRWTMEDIREEIAGAVGVRPADIKLLAFDGYTKTPKYKEVENNGSN